MVGLILSILFFSAASRPLAWTMLALSIVQILIAVVGRQIRLYRQGKLTRPQLAGRIGFEVNGVLLCPLAVVLTAGMPPGLSPVCWVWMAHP